MGEDLIKKQKNNLINDKCQLNQLYELKLSEQIYDYDEEFNNN